MARMLVIYKTPKNPAAFDAHYFNVHIPLAKQLPGLRAYEINQGPICKIAGAETPYLIGILHFDSMQAIHEAFASECGQACAADRRVLVPNDEDIQMFLFDDQAL
ncbi:MAG TPA: EthD family reductase [Cellvibrionaceae bacterium]|nr:EthD family reductase [Cellvibrionaceae bacterium]